MKKLSEVCKIVGVSRRALQGYENMGLLKPTSKTEAGYWLYDDAAIEKLMLIKIFVEVGYDRKTIKSILESPRLDLIAEFDRVVETLQKKQKEIAGMINTVKSLKMTVKLSDNTLRVINNVDVARIYNDKSFASCLEESIVDNSEIDGADFEEAEDYIPFMYNLLAVGYLLGEPENSDLVQNTVNEAYKCLLEITEDFDDDLNKGEQIELFEEFVIDTLDTPEVKSFFDQHCGYGASSYVVRAAQIFISKTKSRLISDQGEEI